jgi:hypothetical protein
MFQVIPVDVRIPVGMGQGLPGQMEGAVEVMDPVFAPLGQFDEGKDIAGIMPNHLFPEGRRLSPAAGALE